MEEVSRSEGARETVKGFLWGRNIRKAIGTDSAIQNSSNFFSVDVFQIDK